MLRGISGPGLFRLFLALLVFMHHMASLSIGTSAVWIFFCLSGYWIYKMWVGKYSRTRRPYLTYLVSRAWRLFPVFWLITALSLLFLAFNGQLVTVVNATTLAHFVLSNVTILGYDSMPERPIGSAWSLDIEMQFYIVAPLIAILFASRRAPAVLVLCGVGIVSFTSFLLNGRLALLSYLVFFVCGMTAASIDWRPSGRLGLLSLGITAAALIMCLTSPWHSILLKGSYLGPLSSYNPLANVVLAFMMMPYAIYTTAQKGWASDGMFADLSYIVYLLHWTPAMLIQRHPGGNLHKLPFIVALWLIVIGASILIWMYYDRPINRLRSRWVAARHKVGASTKGESVVKLAGTAS